MGWGVDVVNESSESKRKAGFERHFGVSGMSTSRDGHNEQRSEQTDTIGAIILLYHHQRVAE